MSDAKSAAERLLESREFCTGWPHPTTNPMRYMFATADVFAVANRCLELEMEVNKLNTECGHLSADKAELEVENAKLQSRLVKACELLRKIAEVEGVDAGVVYLDNEGTTHKETDSDGATYTVYDHEHFSPLGDALVELWKIMKGGE